MYYQARQFVFGTRMKNIEELRHNTSQWNLGYTNKQGVLSKPQEEVLPFAWGKYSPLEVRLLKSKDDWSLVQTAS